MSSLAVPALAFTITPTAQAPVWTEGTQWAFGSETDVGASYAETLDNFTNLLEVVGEVNELSLNGGTEFWLLFEVTEANDTTYVLSMDMAAKASLDATLSFSALKEVAGTYNMSDTPEKEEVTISADVNLDAALVVNADITFDKNTMAIKSVVTNVKITASADFVADNIPNSDMDWTNMTQEYSYDDYDVSGDFELNLGMDLAFDPALNLWDFPMDVGNIWNVTSVATLNGTLTGSLDVQGLPDDMKDNLFTEEFYNITGFTDFPIIFEEIHGVLNSPIDQGVIEEYVTDEFKLDMRCTDYFILNDPYLGQIGVYEIQVGESDSPVKYYYSPDVGFMSYFEIDKNEMDDGVATYINGNLTTMAAVDPAVAEEHIADIADYQSNVNEGQDGIAGFFMDPPYLGIILVAAIVVVAGAAVFLIKRK
ncbi:MAG: hypothetical protein NT131_04290 [Methanomassiliicoccales archaeon]|nr:hypothetical protein [Methanomassiliicoccales archaeon]